MNHRLIYEAVCRTAPATPRLLNIIFIVGKILPGFNIGKNISISGVICNELFELHFVTAKTLKFYLVEFFKFQGQTSSICNPPIYGPANTPHSVSSVNQNIKVGYCA